MIIAPLQAYGLGDIIFCQALAKRWIAEGHEVVWGVLPHYVEGLNRAYPYVKFVDWQTLPIDYNRKDEHDSNGYRVIPLRWADSIMKVPYKDCMKSKYSLFGLDWTNWKEGAMFERDKQKEQSLFEFAAGHMFDTPYSLVFDRFGSSFQYTNTKTWDTKNIHIRVQPSDDYSLFDWAMLMENADEISAVSSSNIYLFELLDIQCPIHIYKREPIEKDHRNYDYILTKPNYILH